MKTLILLLFVLLFPLYLTKGFAQKDSPKKWKSLTDRQIWLTQMDRFVKPVLIGRSIIYRGAAFHHLADIAWRNELPKQLKPEQVRCALTVVIKKTLESPTTFRNGWLTIGLYGEQPSLGDVYNNQGSPYICTNIFLPLGLPDTDPFWANPAAKWTAQKVWAGEDFPKDHSVNIL